MRVLDYAESIEVSFKCEDPKHVYLSLRDSVNLPRGSILDSFSDADNKVTFSCTHVTSTEAKYIKALIDWVEGGSHPYHQGYLLKDPTNSRKANPKGE